MKTGLARLEYFLRYLDSEETPINEDYLPLLALRVPEFDELGLQTSDIDGTIDDISFEIFEGIEALAAFFDMEEEELEEYFGTPDDPMALDDVLKVLDE